MKFRNFAYTCFQLLMITLLLTSETINCYTSLSLSKIYSMKMDRKKVSTKRGNEYDDDSDFEMGNVIQKHMEMPEQLKIFIENYKKSERTNHLNERVQEIQNVDCNKGFGFPGIVIEDVKNSIKSIPTLQSLIVSRLVTPLIDKFSHLLEFKTAYGDFQANEISNKHGPLASFKCSGMPLNLSDTYGVIGYSGDKVPCGLEEDSKLNVCVLFESCGTAAITLDTDSLKCVASLSNLGQALVNASDYILKTSFGISIEGKFPKPLLLGKIVETDMKFNEYLHKGNFFFSIEGKLPPMNLKIASISLDKFILLKEGVTSLSIAAGRKDVEQIAEEINNGQTTGIFEKISNIGLEFAIHSKGKATLFLDEITSGVFPDLELDVKSWDCLITSGSGSTGLPLGIYAKIDANQVSNLSDIKAKIFKHFKSILELLKFTDELDQGSNLVFAIEISIDGIGFEFFGYQMKYKCFF